MLKSEFNGLLFAILLFLFIGPGFISAQKNKNVASAPTLPDVIKSNLMILDAAGKNVDNVIQSEIKIFENGVEQKVTYFAKKESGLSLAFVVDNSGSMRNKLKHQIFIGKTILANLTDSDESMLIRFVDSGKITREQTWTRKRELMYKAFDKLFIEGGQSAVTDALYLAVQLMVERESQAKNERKAIILVTDAEDCASYYKLKDVANLLKTPMCRFLSSLSRTN